MNQRLSALSPAPASEPVLVDLCPVTDSRGLHCGHGRLFRLTAHALVRLLVLGSLPAPIQAHALLFPLPLVLALDQQFGLDRHAGWSRVPTGHTEVGPDASASSVACPAGTGPAASSSQAGPAGRQPRACTSQSSFDARPETETETARAAVGLAAGRAGRLRRGAVGTILADVSDASPIVSVVFLANGRPLASGKRAPYRAELGASRSQSERAVRIEVVATDAAGNTGSAWHSVSFTSSGVLVGQALDDSTGLPLPGASVRVFVAGSLVFEQLTDERGRYSAQVEADTALVRVERAGYLPVERSVSIPVAAAGVVMDARLAPFASAASVGSAGGTLGAPLRILPPTLASTAEAPTAEHRRAAVSVAVSRGPSGEELLRQHFGQVRAVSSTDITVTVPAGAVSGEQGFLLTSLSAQGLPGLLPLGWSPLVAFDLRTVSGSALGQPLALTVSSVQPGTTTAQLAEYRPALGAWVLSAADVAVVGGEANTSMPGLGIFALVVGDQLEPPLVLPGIGGVLPGAAPVALPPSAAAGALAEPASLNPEGETTSISVTLAAAVALPSGSVASAEISGSYQLANGQTAIEEQRVEDLLLYRQPLPAGPLVGARFPLRPSRTFEQGELRSGSVKAVLRAGREDARGTPGGSSAAQLEDGDVRLQVPAGALPANTALTIESIDVPSYAPQGGELQALGAAQLDFSGQVFGLDAELSLACADCTGGPYVLAQLVRVSGVPQAELVAFAAVTSGRLVSTAYPGLRGVRRGGEYVFYRLGHEIGFVAGLTQTSSGPVTAVVTTSGLPFVGVSLASGAYIVASAVAETNVSASVPGTSLVGSGTTTVTAGQTASLDLTLVPSTTTAVTRPVNGATAVDPGRPLEIETSSPLDAATAVLANVRLFRVETAGDVPVVVRLVLSASRRLLAVIPDASLAYETNYRLEATGLLDAFGGPVTVAPVSFRTQAQQAQTFDYRRLLITVPDVDGQVHVSASAGTFALGTRLLILNGGNGAVLTLEADNQGGISGELPASVSDRLLLTITDPAGGILNLTWSQYYDVGTGLTTVNSGGGVIGDADGRAELRIPEGALLQPARLKLAVLPLDTFPATEAPNLGESMHLGGIVRLTSPDMPVFQRGVALVMEKPAEAPAGAFYQYYKRFSVTGGAEPRVAYQMINEGRVVAVPESQGFAAPARAAQTKAVSVLDYRVEPLSSVIFSPWTNFNTGLAFGSGAVTSLMESHAFLMWSFWSTLPGSPLPGVVRGRVLRQQWGAPGVPPTSVPVNGVTVTASDSAGEIFTSQGQAFAISQGQGDFAFTDPRYTGGAVQLVAIDPERAGQSVTATAWEVQPNNTHDELRGRYAETVATVTLPALDAPPPQPDVRVRLFKLVEGQREELDTGIVLQGTPLVIGIKLQFPGLGSGQPEPFEVRTDGVSIQGSSAGLTVVADTVPPTAPTGNTYVVQADGNGGLYLPSNPGTYVVRVKLMPTAVGAVDPLWVDYVFVAVGEGGGVSTDPVNPPSIRTQGTAPRPNAKGVPISVLPQVAFSEPVKKVLTSVSLRLENQPVAVKLVGITPEGAVVDVLSDEQVVTAVTLQPLQALQYGKVYELAVETALEDLDVPTPKTLLPRYSASFTTFDPEEVGTGVSELAIVGFAVNGDRLYAAQTNYGGGIVSGQNDQDGSLKVYNLSDPTDLQLLGEDYVHAPPSDLAIDPVRNLAAVSQGWKLAYIYHPDGYYQVVSSPANVNLYDVTTEPPRWVGVTSLTQGILDGMPDRVVLKGGKLYAASSKKGLQIADVNQMQANFVPDNGTPAHGAMLADLGLNGSGVGLEYVVTIPVPNDAGQPAYLNDLEVPDLNWNGNVQPLMLAVGNKLGLVVADPGAAAVVQRAALPDLKYGDAVLTGTVNSTSLALVGGSVQGGGRLWVLSLAPLATSQAPTLLGMLDVPAGITDLLWLDENAGTVIAATGAGVAYVVSVASPAAPALVGEPIEGIGSHLALYNGLLLSIRRGYISTPQTNEFGVKSKALGELALITTDPARVVVGEKALKSAEPFKLKVQVIPSNKEVSTAYVEYMLGPQRVGVPVNVNLTNGRGVLPLPQGFNYPWLGESLAAPRLVVNAGTADELKSSVKAWQTSEFDVQLAGIEPNDPRENENEEAAPLVAGSEETRAGETTAENEELARRFVDAMDQSLVPPFTVSWQADFSGSSVLPSMQQTQDGLFEARLDGSWKAGIFQRVTAKAGSVVLGSSTVLVEPGPAASVVPTVPTGPGAGGSSLPADGTTQVIIHIEAKDGDENPVSDGTPVNCVVEGYGEIVPLPDNEVPTTTDGVAVCTYRAGTVINQDQVKVEVDGVEKVLPLTTLGLKPTLILPSGPVPVGELVEVQVQVDSFAFEPAANGTPVAWLSEAPIVSGQREVQNGRASVTVRPKEGRIHKITAVVGGASATGGILVVAPPQTLRIEYGRRLLAGDITQDEIVSLPRVTIPDPLGEGPDAATPAAATTESFDVQVYASTVVTVSGGIPGETLRLALGRVGQPNRLPESRYRMRVIAGTEAPDEFSRHPGVVVGAVTVVADSVEPLGASYRFDGGRVEVPATGPLAQVDGLQFSTFVKPRGAGELVGRQGSFALSLVEEGDVYRPRLTAYVGGQAVTLDASGTLARDDWSELHGGFLDGRMTLTAAGAEVGLDLSGGLDVGTGVLQVGAGFVGNLQDLRVFHAAAGAPLLGIEALSAPAAAGAVNSPDAATATVSEQATATFDEDGTANFRVYSLGNQPSTPNLFDPEDPLEPVYNRNNWVGLRMWAYDILHEEQGDASFGSFSKQMVAFSVLIAAEIRNGPEDDTPPPILLADIFFSVHPYTAGPMLVRDVGVITEHAATKRFNTGDSIALPFLMLSVGAKKVEGVKDAWRAADELLKAGKGARFWTRWAARWAANPGMQKQYGHILDAMRKYGDEVTEAMVDVLHAADKGGWNRLDDLERLLSKADDVPAVAKALKQGLDANNVRLAQQVMRIGATAGKVTAKAVRGMVKALRANPPPDLSRLKRVAKHFPTRVHEVWEKLDEVVSQDATTGAVTRGLTRVLHDLGSKIHPNNYMAGAADAVLSFARKLVSGGQKVEEFERKAVVPVLRPWHWPFKRFYDITYKLGQISIDIDVKRWSSFSPTSKIARKEAKKLQRDLAIKGQNAGDYGDLVWAVPEALKGKEEAIKAWMKKQFNTPFVRGRFADRPTYEEARRLFFLAVDKPQGGVLQFFTP